MEDSNNDVITLRITDQVVRFIPTGFYQHFPFLTVLKIWSSELILIRQEDIRDMKYLTDLSLSDNHIEVLDSNLFEFNTPLIKVDFSRNRIKFVGSNLLSPLKNLLFADFYHNDCISEGARYSFNRFKEVLKHKCPPTSEMMTNEVDSLSREVERLRREIETTQKKVKICEAKKDDHMHFQKLDSLFPTIFKSEISWNEN